MNAIDIINKTKKSIELSDSEISWLVKSYTDGMIPDYQMSAWLMAVCINGLTERETLSLTYTMRDSGEIMNLDIGLTAESAIKQVLLSDRRRRLAEFVLQKCPAEDLVIQAEQ